MTVQNPLSLEEKELVIKGVIQNNVQKAVYTSRELAAELTGLDAEKYNCLMSREKLDIPEAEIAQEILRSDISDQADAISSQMEFLVNIIIGLGAVICVAAVYVAVNMLIGECRGNISMLKVLGYRDRQISRIVLNVHHILLPLGILLAIPAVYAVLDTYFILLVDYGVLLVDTWIAPKTYVISVGLTAACYFGSLYLLRRKGGKVDMTESLKDNRE